MSESSGSPWDDYHKWRRLAYEARYGHGSWDKNTGEFPKGFHEDEYPFKAYWSNELPVGILERDNKYVGVACLVAKEVVDKENFVRRFGLSFEKNVQWKLLQVCWIIFLGLLFSRLFWSRSTRFLSSLNLTFRERKIETDYDASNWLKS